MKKRLVLFSVLVLAAGAAILVAQYATTPPAQQAMQKEPYTAKFFGPWNEAVAKTHVPMVKMEKAAMGYKVNVQIDNHPMDAQKPHWIEWIRIEDMKGKILAEKTFKPTDPSPPMVEFEIAVGHDKLKVLEHCNIHGTWLNEVMVPMK